MGILIKILYRLTVYSTGSHFFVYCDPNLFTHLLQLSETDDQELPPFPPAKDIKDQNVQPNGGGAPDSGPILPVPHGIRPTLAKYRFEVRI